MFKKQQCKQTCPCFRLRYRPNAVLKFALMWSVLMIGLLAGCGNRGVIAPRNTVTLTIWHPYGHQMKSSMEGLIEEFNETVGAEKGIHIQTTYIADAIDLNEKLIAAADGEPGAPALPEIAIIYPRGGIALIEKGMLIDFSTQFSEDELSLFVPAFLEEGKLGGDSLYIMPVAKSTEMMYVNLTIFDRFAEDTGVRLAQLSTFEGVLDAADRYYEWSEGKSFVHITDLFNWAMIGFQQLGGEFVVDNSPAFSSPIFKRIWEAYYPFAVQGGIAIFDGYADLLFASGEIVCGIGTSASVTYFPEMVTYADNTKEEMRFALLPLPVFEGGEKVTLQRGAGVCVLKSDSTKEYAAGVFIKWLTDPTQNLRFATQTGYMPVTEAAYNSLLTDGVRNVTNENIKMLYETLAQVQKEYTFYYPPVFDGLEEMQNKFNRTLRKAAEDSRREYLSLLPAQEAQQVYARVSEGVFEGFVSNGG